MGTGTQKVEELIQKTFPNARVARIDHDSSKNSSSTIKVLQEFHDGEIDILLGTQMIAKGLDFPEITLVGIINADLGLHIPDFRSSERTFQLIYQAAGRSGRGKKRGEVVIQTYDKENIVINAASKLNLLRGCIVISFDKSGFKHKFIKLLLLDLIFLNSGKYLPACLINQIGILLFFRLNVSCKTVIILY